jgi:hypothetical protein
VADDRKPYKHYRKDNLHPTRVHPEVNVPSSVEITLFKNVARTLRMNGYAPTMPEAIEMAKDIMPFIRQVCQEKRPHWTCFAKFEKGLKDLAGTQRKTLAKYAPGADRSRMSPERRAGINLALRFVEDGTVLLLGEAEPLINAEMVKIKAERRKAKLS